MTTPMPESVKGMMVQDASKVEEVAAQVDFIFCAVNMPKDEIKALEEAYAKAECPVVSNNSANRFTPDVPMVVPEINADHIEIIPAQRKRLGTKRGFIAVKSNCSLQSYVPALHPLMKEFGVNKALVCTYQAISGAGKTFDRMPEIVDNVIPYIGGEEEKSEREPLKLWGHIEGDHIVNAEKPTITAQCFRVPVSDGHTAAVFVSFDKKPTKEQMLEAWANFRGSFTEVKKPEHALKLFVRFAIAKGAITYGMELMLALFNIVQGTISTIMGSAGFSTPQQTVLPPELITSVEECGFFESIPLWAVTLIGGLFITVMSFILIMTVYGRFFKLYMYTALAPIPLSTFAGEPSQNVGKSFIKSYCAVCLEGAVIVLSCIIFSLFASSPPVVNPDAAAVTQVWSYIGELLFNMLVLVGSVKMSDRIIREMMGL